MLDRMMTERPDAAAPSVVGLYTAAAAGAPIEPHQSVELIAGQGIAGDRYALGRGFWSDPIWPDQEITLIESEAVAALTLQPGQLRRNVETRGLALGGLIGVTFRLGAAELTGVRLCDPCAHLEQLTRSGIARAIGSRGGLRARIVRGGRVSIGDPIVIAVAGATRKG
jgi:hypothetical protein